MNENKKNLFMINNKINNNDLKYKNNKVKSQVSKNNVNSKNKNKSDKKIKQNNSPYYIIHKKIESDIMSPEKQKILLQKRELEIKDLKKKCQKLEIENQKYQLQNIILKNNYNNNINKNKNNNELLSNNTSSNFPIRNEIKKLWENLAKVELLNNFIDFENEPEIIYHLICELFLLSNKMIKEHCLLKYQEILKIMGVKNNLLIIKDIEIQFKNFMKEHLSEIFNYLQDISFLNDYKNQFKNIVKNSIKCINEKNMLLFEDILEQYEFNAMIKNINDIILFTQFNEPTLSFQIEETYDKRKVKYLKINNENKKDYIIINNHGNISGNYNSVILLEPPCLKSGFIFNKELKPVLMILEQIPEEENNINENKIGKNNNIINKKGFRSNEKKKYIDDKIKFNSINNTSRRNRNLNCDIINKNNKEDFDFHFIIFNNNSNSNNIKNNNNKNKVKKNTYYNNNKATIDKELFFEDNKKNNKIITINSSRPNGTKFKKFKKLSISKDINSEEPGFCSTDEKMTIDNNQIKYRHTILSNHPINKRYNKIHRIKSANTYYENKKKKIIIKNDDIKTVNSNKNLFLNSYDDIQSYAGNNNNKENNNINIRKGKEMMNKNNKKSLINNPTLKISKTKTNIKANKYSYKNSILLMNKIKNKEIISPSKTKKENFSNDKENNIKNNSKNNSRKYNKSKNPKIKINYSNNNSKNNILNNKCNSNTYFSNLSNNKLKKESKRIDLLAQKNSFIYSNLEEIKKIMDEINFIHKPIIMISTNSKINNNTHNAKKQLKNKYHNFNKKNKNKENDNNYNTINNSIKQLISLSQQKIIENGNINYNNNTHKEIKYNNDNIKTKSLETKNKCFKNKNKYINDKGLFYKQFSIDETTFNTSSQFNLTHEINNKTNKNYNQFVKKKKESKTLPNDIKSKYKSNFNHNMNNNNFKANKNKVKEIEINIDGLSNKSNHYNTINAKPSKNRCYTFFNNFLK